MKWRTLGWRRSGAMGSRPALRGDPPRVPDRSSSFRVASFVFDRGARIDESSDDFRFAAAVAGFGMLLRDSSHRGEITVDQMIQLTESGLSGDLNGYREQFVELAEREALTYYDAAYLWLAQELAADLVSLDSQLTEKRPPGKA